MWYLGLPCELEQQRRVVKGTSRRIHDMTLDATVLARCEQLLTELQKLVLTHKALPAVTGSPRRIDSTGGTASGVASRTICIGAIPRARNPQVRGQREILESPGHVLHQGGVPASRVAALAAPVGTRRAVDRAARVVDYVRPGVLITVRIRFHHVPVKDREDLIKASETLQVGAVEVGETAVAVPDVGRYEREARFGVLRYAITVQVEERPGGEVILPAVNADFSHIADGARAGRSMAQGGVGSAAHADGCRNPVYDLIVPLVEDRKSPITSGDPLHSKVPLVIALREGDVSAIRATQTGVALRVGKGIASATAVQSLIRWPAHACAGDHSCHGLEARRCAGTGAERLSAVIDGLRIGKADGNVVSRRSKLLEVARFIDLDESFVVLAAIQGVGLQPFFAPGNPVGPGRGYDAVPSGRHIRNDHLAGQWG